MGVLVPDDFVLASLVNDAERRVVEAFRDGLSDSWLILPSVVLRTDQRDYELDVVLLHEDFGIVDIEGKGHRVEGRDGVWGHGGSVATLLAVWRVHGLDAILRRVWQSGVVLAGCSAGSICWFTGGTTDSYGPTLRPVTTGLGFLPYDNGVHYDSEAQRRPLVHELVASGVLQETHCTDDGVGLLYHGTTLVEAVSERKGAGAFIVRRTENGVEEERVEPRLL